MKHLKKLWIPLAFVGGLLVLLVARNPKASLKLAGAALAMLLVGWGASALNRTVSAAPEFAASRAAFAVAAVPPSIQSGIVASLHKTHVAPLGTRILGPDAAREVGESLAKSPWVRRVASVDLDASPSVKVDLVFREPVAAVAWGRSVGYVDEEGILLPTPFYRLQELACPVIVGVKAKPPARAGELWKDEGLTAGLDVLKRFRTDPELKAAPAAGLQTIDVANVGEKRPDQPEIVCLTRGRLALRFSVSRKMGRPSLDEQLGRMRQVLRIDRNLALPKSYVDLRFDRPVGA